MTTRRVLSPVPWIDIRVLPGSEEVRCHLARYVGGYWTRECDVDPESLGGIVTVRKAGTSRICPTASRARAL